MSAEIMSWPAVVYKSLVVTTMHPFDYGKTLIQIGHEPLPPFPTRTWLGKPIMGLPGIFQYMGIIRNQDGFFGLFRGLGPRLCESLVNTMVYNKVSECIVIPASNTNKKEKKEDDEEEEEEVEETLVRFTWKMVRHGTSRSAGIIVSQPFYVIAVRTMAQFIGRETQYTGLFASAREIYNETGVTGFFRGLTPRLTGELLSILLAATLGYTINTYVVGDRRSRGFVTAVTGFVASTLTYPFHVVSACMAVTGSSLAAGNHPYMPVYVDWTDCWSHLSRNNQLKRGSSLIWRYQYPPKPLEKFNVSQFAMPSPSM